MGRQEECNGELRYAPEEDTWHQVRWSRSRYILALRDAAREEEGDPDPSLLARRRSSEVPDRPFISTRKCDTYLSDILI